MRMSSDIVISVRNLCKRYRSYAHPLDRLLPGRKNRCRQFNALTDVNFDIRRGESVGIIGRNGSGKSTLLQLICGIRKPTSGSITVVGRISALLELGAGFHPEFSGRENVYLQGAILGFSRNDMEERFEYITKFADIGEFIDQPVKTYSRGMFVRLAFAVAISVDPDILVVDEALAVGDVSFQSKCYQRMREICDRGGTILFVTHAMDSVIQLCDRTILLDEGQHIMLGNPKLVVGMMHKLLYAPPDKRDAVRAEIQALSSDKEEAAMTVIQDNSKLYQSGNSSEPDGAIVNECYDPELHTKSTINYESQGAIINDHRIETLDGKKVNCLISGRKYKFMYFARFNRTAENVRLGMMIKSSTGIALGGTLSAVRSQEAIPVVNEGMSIMAAFVFTCRLNPGTYFINAGISGTVNSRKVFLHRVLDIEVFRVISSGSRTATSMIDFDCESNIEFFDHETPDAPAKQH